MYRRLTRDLARDPGFLARSPGEAMRQGQRDYMCPKCDATITVSNEREPAVVFDYQRNEPTVRVVTVMGVEVHRCVVPGVPRTVRRF